MSFCKVNAVRLIIRDGDGTQQGIESCKSYPSEVPVLVNRLDCPVELLAQGLGEEPFDGYIEFLGEDDSQAWVNVVLLSR